MASFRLLCYQKLPVFEPCQNFDSRSKIILKCAQTLTYSELHAVCYPPFPIPSNLETLPHQLNRPNTIYIPHPTLHNLSQPNDIKELANLIFLEIDPTTIPEPQTIP